MARKTIQRGAWIVVADGRKALFLTNQGDEDLPDIRLVETIEAADNPATSEQGADRPGRLAAGPNGPVAADQTDWHQQAEQAFAAKLVKLIEGHQRTDERPLIIVAAPRMLGDLRRLLPSAVSRTVVAEIDRDLVHQPLKKIEQALTIG